MLRTSEEIRAIAASLVDAERIIFPVRHHSPASAWHIQALFEAVRPSRVLIEGPRGFTAIAPLLAHPDARMPLAIYSYSVQRDAPEGTSPRRAAFYPFCDYSPELVALRCASARGIDVRFIDLEFAEQCQIEPAPQDDEAQSLLDERHFRRSRFLEQLAQQLGCRGQEELWEHLFEAPLATSDLPAYLESMSAYCELARVECTTQELTADGTLQREAEMAWHVREAMAQRGEADGPVLAVVGGFHAVAMPALLRSPRPRPAISRAAVSDEASALIRYSFDRLDRLNGYSAGMTSPAWHQLLWERMQTRARAGATLDARVRTDAALSMIFEIADALRTRHGVPVPAPALAAAYEQSLRLAQLRQRAAPLRNDVLDAVTSCFVKGAVDAEGTVVLGTANQILSGRVIGRVPPGASRPPLVKDFEYRARRQRLRIDDPEPRRAVLDIYRRSEHRATSRLFHGLQLLGVPLGARTAGPDFIHGIGLDRLQEHWQYSFSAATEAALVEASIYGVTVPLAVAAKFIERLEQIESGEEANDARRAAGLTVQACVLGLHDHLGRVIGGVTRALGSDPQFESMAGATFTLGILWDSREPLEARDVPELPALIRSAYERTIYLGHGLRGTQSTDQQATLQALTRLRELLVSGAGETLDPALFWNLVDTLRSSHDAALIRGGCSGLAYLSGQLPESALAEAVSGHLTGVADPRDAVGFLRGLLYCAREAAWQQPALLGVLDGLLDGWDDATFIAALPELRLAFAEMTPKETDRIAAAVAGLHGAASLGPLVTYDLAEADVQRHLQWSRLAAETIAADGLEEWLA